MRQRHLYSDLPPSKPSPWTIDGTNHKPRTANTTDNKNNLPRLPGYKKIVAQNTVGKQELLQAYTHTTVNKFLSANTYERQRMHLPKPTHLLIESMEKQFAWEASQYVHKGYAHPPPKEHRGVSASVPLPEIVRHSRDPELYKAPAVVVPISQGIRANVGPKLLLERNKEAQQNAKEARRNKENRIQSTTLDSTVETHAEQAEQRRDSAEPEQPESALEDYFRELELQCLKRQSTLQVSTASLSKSAGNLTTRSRRNSYGSLAVLRVEQQQSRDVLAAEYQSFRRQSLEQLLTEVNAENAARRAKMTAQPTYHRIGELNQNSRIQELQDDDTQGSSGALKKDGNANSEIGAPAEKPLKPIRLTATTVGYLKHLAELRKITLPILGTNGKPLHLPTAEEYLESIIVGEKDEPFEIRNDRGGTPSANATASASMRIRRRTVGVASIEGKEDRFLRSEALPIQRRQFRSNLAKPLTDTVSTPLNFQSEHHAEIGAELNDRKRAEEETKRMEVARFLQMQNLVPKTVTYLNRFVELANPRQVNAGPEYARSKIDFVIDKLWNVDDFLQSSGIYMKKAPEAGTADWIILERALRLSLEERNASAELRHEVALMLADLQSIEGMRICRQIYRDILHRYTSKHSNLYHRRHPHEVKLSARALLHLGELSIGVLSIYMQQYEECSRAEDLRIAALLLSAESGPGKDLERYVHAVETMFEMLDDPKWRMRRAALYLLELFVDFEDRTPIGDDAFLRRLMHAGRKLPPPTADRDGIPVNALGEMQSISSFPSRPASPGAAAVALANSSDLVAPIGMGSITALRADAGNANSEKPLWGEEDTTSPFFKEMSVGMIVLDRILDVANSDWSETVRDIARTIGLKIGNERSAIHWLRSCLNASNPGKRILALRTFSTMGKVFPEMRAEYFKCFLDPFIVVRREACKVACVIARDDADLLTALCDLFDDPDWTVRAYAAKAIGMCGNTGTLVRERIHWYITHEHNPAVLAEACIAVRLLGLVDEEMATLLTDLLDHTHGTTHECVEEALRMAGIQPMSSANASKLAQQNIHSLVREIGTKKDIIEQLLRLEDGEYEEHTQTW